MEGSTRDVPPDNKIEVEAKGGHYYVKPNGSKKYFQKNAKVVTEHKHKMAQKRIRKAVGNGMPESQ
jgi:hypothetical protein